MPKLPNEVKTSIQVPNMPQATPGAMGVDLGTATQQMGQMTAKVGQQAQEVGFSLLKAYDEAVVAQTYNDAVNKMTELDKVVRTAQGTKAVEAQKEWVKAVDKIQSEAVKDMPPAQRSLFDLNFGKAKRTHQTYIGTHTAKEVIAAKVNSLKIASQNAVADFENGVALTADDMVTQVASYGQTAFGLTGADLDNYVKGVTSKAYQNRYANLLKGGQVKYALSLTPGNFKNLNLPNSNDLAKNWQNPKSLVSTSFDELGRAKYFVHTDGEQGSFLVQGFYQDPVTGEVKEYKNAEEAWEGNAPYVEYEDEGDARVAAEVLGSQKEREAFLTFDKGGLSAMIAEREADTKAYTDRVKTQAEDMLYQAVSSGKELPSKDEISSQLNANPLVVGEVYDKIFGSLKTLQNEIAARPLTEMSVSDINEKVVKLVYDFRDGKASANELTYMQAQLNTLGKYGINVSPQKALLDDTFKAYRSGKLSLSDSALVSFEAEALEIYNSERYDLKGSIKNGKFSLEEKIASGDKELIEFMSYVEQYKDYIAHLEEQKGGALSPIDYSTAKEKFLRDFKLKLSGKIDTPFDLDVLKGVYGPGFIDNASGLIPVDGNGKGSPAFDAVKSALSAQKQ